MLPKAAVFTAVEAQARRACEAREFRKRAVAILTGYLYRLENNQYLFTRSFTGENNMKVVELKLHLMKLERHWGSVVLPEIRLQ